MAGAVSCGLKTGEALDLALVYSEVPTVAAGVFTTNKIQAAPLLVTRRHLAQSHPQAIVINSGGANACTGERGRRDAEKMASLGATKLNLRSQEVLVASTGVIGAYLDMAKIEQGLSSLRLSRGNGHRAAQAIMTTDLVSKEAEAVIEAGGRAVTIGGMAKGSGMIHPRMATMLAFITTDAAIEQEFLREALIASVNKSFNMISIDGDTSTNDMVLILANGLAGNPVLKAATKEAAEFCRALDGVAISLAKKIARDGEGATQLIEVVVEGARSEDEARLAARSVVSSNLVKTAVYGRDPNWGRIVAAVGYSGAELVEEKIDLWLGPEKVLERGVPHGVEKETLRRCLEGDVQIRVNLNLGHGSAIAWGCDMSEEYVRINSQYTT